MILGEKASQLHFSQVVFADFNLEGELDLVLPVCFDPTCTNSSMLQHTVKEVWQKGDKLEWKIMSLDLGGLRFVAASDEVLNTRIIVSGSCLQRPVILLFVSFHLE